MRLFIGALSAIGINIIVVRQSEDDVNNYKMSIFIYLLILSIPLILSKHGNTK